MTHSQQSTIGSEEFSVDSLQFGLQSDVTFSECDELLQPTECSCS